MVPVAKKVAAGATTEAAIVSAVAPTVTAHVNHVLLCHVATNQPLHRAVTSLPMHHEAKATGVMHHVLTSLLVIASVLSRHVVIVQRLHRAATSPLSLLVVMLPAAIVLLAVTASATLHHAVISPLVANARAAIILTQAHVQIAPPLIVLPTQANQHALPVILHLAPLHLVARPSLLAATAQRALAHRARARHVPQPVHAAALTLTAVVVKAAR